LVGTPRDDCDLFYFIFFVPLKSEGVPLLLGLVFFGVVLTVVMAFVSLLLLLSLDWLLRGVDL